MYLSSDFENWYDLKQFIIHNKECGFGLWAVFFGFLRVYFSVINLNLNSWQEFIKLTAIIKNSLECSGVCLQWVEEEKRNFFLSFYETDVTRWHIVL